MRRWRLWAGLGIFGMASVALTAPLQGPITLRRWIIQASEMGPGGELVPRAKRFKLDFRGGERACVIVSGDHDPIVPVTVAIYEESTQRKLFEDISSQQAPDIVAAIWYPPRDGHYVVEITNKSKEYNGLTVSIR
jgi:hypothetical protein